MDSTDLDASASDAARKPAPVLPSEHDLRVFLAVRPEPYLRHYRALYGGRRREKSSRRQWAVSWLWPAFLVTVPWMFYRKMYSGGIILIALPIIFEHILPGALFVGSGIVIAIAAGVFGKSWYLDHALNRIEKARREYSSDDGRFAYIAHAGNISVAGAIFGLLTQAVTLTVLVIGLLPPTAS